MILHQIMPGSFAAFAFLSPKTAKLSFGQTVEEPVTNAIMFNLIKMPRSDPEYLSIERPREAVIELEKRVKKRA
jgi:hypothetical protein